MSDRIHASHLDTRIAGDLRRANEASILQREKARDAQRAAQNPPVPTSERDRVSCPVSKPGTAVPGARTTGKPVEKVTRKSDATASTAGRSVGETSSPPPPGSLVLTPEEAVLMLHLIDTHPETRKR
jgi:hypothetical protein